MYKRLHFFILWMQVLDRITLVIKLTWIRNSPHFERWNYYYRFCYYFIWSIGFSWRLAKTLNCFGYCFSGREENGERENIIAIFCVQWDLQVLTEWSNQSNVVELVKRNKSVVGWVAVKSLVFWSNTSNWIEQNTNYSFSPLKGFLWSENL